MAIRRIMNYRQVATLDLAACVLDLYLKANYWKRNIA
jgi:hypothetical protein